MWNSGKLVALLSLLCFCMGLRPENELSGKGKLVNVADEDSLAITLDNDTVYGSAAVSVIEQGQNNAELQQTKKLSETLQTEPTRPLDATPAVLKAATKKTRGRKRKSAIKLNQGPGSLKVVDHLTPDMAFVAAPQREAVVPNLKVNESSTLLVRINATPAHEMPIYRATTQEAEAPVLETLDPVKEVLLETADDEFPTKSVNEKSGLIMAVEENTGLRMDGAKAVTRDVDELEILSIYDAVKSVFIKFPESAWHVKVIAILCIVGVFCAKIACIVMCFRCWRRRQEEAASKEAVKKLCSKKNFAATLHTDQNILSKIFESPDLGIPAVPKTTESMLTVGDDEKEHCPPSVNDDSLADDSVPSKSSLANDSKGTKSSWSTVYSENGIPCYQNIVTGETTWKKAGKESPTLASSPDTVEDVLALPAGCSLNDASESEIEDK